MPVKAGESRTKARKLLGSSALVGLVAGAVATQATPAAAQQMEPSAEASEIIVTARKRDESVQDVPVTIAVLSGDTLQATGVLRSSELQFAVPGFYVQNFETRATITLRGVGAQISGGTSSVATHLNGIYQASSAAQLNRLFDVAQVEVLKGPQGTLYGRNSTGGALNITTRAPDDTLEANGSIGYGTFNTVRADAGISIPIGDEWGVRLAGSYLKGDGQFFNRFNGRETGRDDFVGGRATVAGKAGPIDVSAFVQYTRDKDTTQTLIPVDPATARPRFGWNQTVQDQPEDMFLDRELVVAGLTLGADLGGGFSVKSITGYLDYNDDSAIDVNPVVSPVRLEIQTPQLAKQWSQELQLLYSSDPLNVVLGAYYLDDDQGAGRFLTLDPAGLQLFNNRTIDEVEGLAFFGDASIKVAEGLNLNVGARWNQDKIRNAFDGSGLIDGSNFDLNTTEDAFTWRIGFDWRPAEAVLLFANASTGFQAGFNQNRTDAITGDEAPDTVGPESLTAYEFGVKTILPENMGLFNASFFYYDYSDMQVSVGGLFLNPDGSLNTNRPPFFFTENAGKARIYGVDIQLTDFKLHKYLTLEAAATLLSAKFTEYSTIDDNRNVVDLAGNTLPRAPEVSVTSALNLGALPLGFADFSMRGEVNHRSRTFFSETNERLVGQGPVTLVNASARLEFADGRYAITANARNLTQARFFDFYGGSTFGNAGEFRTFEIGFAAQF
jgi:iron complex outermembrane receptor protein